jgi:hypothetical protein
MVRQCTSLLSTPTPAGHDNKFQVDGSRSPSAGMAAAWPGMITTRRPSLGWLDAQLSRSRPATTGRQQNAYGGDAAVQQTQGPRARDGRRADELLARDRRP